MTVAVVQELHNTLAGTPLTVSQAANFTMGDWLYAWCLDNSAGGTLHAPDPLADWSLVPSSNIVSGNMEAAWYYRRVAAGEGKDAVLDVTGSTQLQMQVYEVSGGGLPGTAVTTGPTSTNALLSGSVTPANGGLVLVGYVRLGTVSGNGSYSNSFVADIAAAVRIAAAHKAGTGASESTTLTTTETGTKVSSIFAIDPAVSAPALPRTRRADMRHLIRR